MFTKFYRQFITENTHGNVKHKVLAGTNRIVKALAADTKGITNAFISGSSIAESIAFWPEDARPKLPEDETNPITDEMKQQLLKLANYETSLKKDLQSLYYAYCMAVFDVSWSRKDMDVVLAQTGEINPFGGKQKGVVLNNVSIILSKGNKATGAYNPSSNSIKLYIDPSTNDRTQTECVRRLITNMTAPMLCDVFIRNIQDKIKRVLSHELTHTWQEVVRGDSYIGHKDQLAMFADRIPGQQFITNMAFYMMSPSEQESQRTEAWVLFKKERDYTTYLDAIIHESQFRKSVEDKDPATFNKLKFVNPIYSYLFRYQFLYKLWNDKALQNDMKKRPEDYKGYTKAHEDFMENGYDGIPSKDIIKAFENLTRYLTKLMSGNVEEEKESSELTSEDFNDFITYWATA